MAFPRIDVRHATAAYRAGLALLVAYAFLIVLMTASAQQHVVTRLGANPAATAAGVEYSGGYAKVLRSESLTRRLAALQKEYDSEAKAAADLAEISRVAWIDLQNAWFQTQPLWDAAESARGTCQLNRPKPSEVDADRLVVDWRIAVGCANSDVFSPALKERILKADSSPTSVSKAYWKYLDSTQMERSNQRQLDGHKLEIDTIQKELARDRPVVAAFDDLATIRSSWLLGHGSLAPLPPVLMQILLAATSGAFGALLITLVLAVYPNTAFAFSSSGAFGPRVALGALISICTFVMLGGGTAILGSASAFDSGEANYLAFTALGLLSGMFSDRVAHWLSKRADAFFSEAGPSPAEGSPPGPRGG